MSGVFRVLLLLLQEPKRQNSFPYSHMQSPLMLKLYRGGGQ